MSLWTDYVTDSMEETAEEGPSFWYKLGGFLIRTTLIALVPEIGLEMLGEELAEEVAEVAAEDLVAKAIEKTTEFGGEYAQGKLEEKKTESAVKKRGAELRGQTSSLGGQLKTILHNAMQPILDDYYYVDWLNQAALEDLNLFRIPVEIPIIPEEQIRLLVAQTLAEFLHAEVQHGENKDADRDVRIDVDYLINPSPPMADIDVKGPNLFYKEFFDHRINEIPKVALKVFVKSSKYNLEYPLDGGIAGVMAENGEERWRIFADFAASFPSKTPLLIEREADGPIKISGGSLYEQFYIHQFLNPSDNLKSMISDYVRGIGSPVSTMNPDEVPDVHHETAEAAQHFADYLGQSLKDSADYFLVTVIGQKRLGWFQNFDED